MAADRLTRVLLKARADEAFFRRLLKNPKSAMELAGIKLPAADLRRLSRMLARGFKIDLPAAIRMSRPVNPDPWPMSWVEFPKRAKRPKAAQKRIG